MEQGGVSEAGMAPGTALLHQAARKSAFLGMFKGGHVNIAMNLRREPAIVPAVLSPSPRSGSLSVLT